MIEKTPTPIDFWEIAGGLLTQTLRENGGVLATVVDDQGGDNVITLGWGLIGPHYHKNPMVAIAVCPPRYSWRFLEATGEFVIAVPADGLRKAVDYCGTHSGRDGDKFAAAGLTQVRSRHIKAPSILECPINVECRTYTKVSPPHMLLTPEHRTHPIEEQHTIYFAEVLGTYSYE